ncbi:hypothetical protein FJV41_16155 [Myxococcus llanfairpwllgwyngyllgogerychwyrndrobwllllantysiliogogogochensis]|uniref:Uncharacterized protein n=1 Tax=Myxococcus llanfairpwllgwyngyllgogerychwyrndrobwllllantysiliogogogochensis TaxID=2590453 RepID=A0A540X141_9BACT|nr:hypothetical protein [Myxococcus llanfairpwllgwyngyllgogerychwyrndrobwllllantysiliogogogochensis]TQF14920.1 hypothetical protein FJV41_16155 [Myxococcus llanfairpwllgwyngyllgogerychwyrndrobwllllantysiliogogogochensis]
MDHDNSLLGTLWRHLEASGFQTAIQQHLPPGTDLQQGFQEFKLLAAKLGLEAYEAEVRGVPLCTAVGDEQNFPTLFRIHVGLRDVFTLEIPKELQGWAEQSMALGASSSDEFQKHLGRMATDSTLAAGERALARFALFELLCASLFFADYAERGQLAAFGVERCDLEALAQKNLTLWLQLPAEQAVEVRPLNIMLAGAMESLMVRGEIIQQQVLTWNVDMVAEAQQRKILERRLQEMNTPDALLIRNAVAGLGLLDEQYVTIETLQEQHSIVLGGTKRNTLDQRFKRIKVSIADGKWPKRKSKAIIDLALPQFPTEDEE